MKPGSRHADALNASGTVLVADDEPRVRQALVMMLSDLGFNVLEAATAPACLDLYRANAGVIDALVVDLRMPGGGGVEVVRALRAEGSRLGVVLSSGYGEDAVRAELGDDARLTFLEKPFDFTSFVRALEAALGARIRDA